MQQRTTHLLSGFILISVAGASLLFVTLSLTSFQAYQRMRQVTVGSTVYSVWGLEQLIKVRETRDAEIATLSASQNTLLEKLNEKTAEVKAAYLRLSDREISVDSELAGVYSYLRSLDREFRPEDSYLRKFPDIEARLRQIQNVPPELKATYEKVRDDNIGELRRLEQAEDNARKDRERLKAMVDDGQKEIQKSANRAELPSSVTGDDARKLSAALDEYASIRDFMQLMLHVPYELAVVLIVICSGFLGSSVHLASNFASVSFTQLPSVYLTRLILGALTSLVLFIFVQAGSMLAIDPKSLNQSVANLNPFFVSFVGIIGGLSSERVLGTLSDAANRFLHDSTNERPRYAMAPVKTFVADPAELGKFCDVTVCDPEDLKRMILGDQPIPPRLQSELTIWLRADKRTLFTEYAPEKKAAEQPAAPPPQAAASPGPDLPAKAPK